MAAYRRVYDSCHLQADCQEAASAPEPSVIDYGLPLTSCICALADFRGGADTPPPGGGQMSGQGTARSVCIRLYCSDRSFVPLAGFPSTRDWNGTVARASNDQLLYLQRCCSSDGVSPTRPPRPGPSVLSGTAATPPSTRAAWRVRLTI